MNELEQEAVFTVLLYYVGKTTTFMNISIVSNLTKWTNSGLEKKNSGMTNEDRGMESLWPFMCYAFVLGQHNIMQCIS